MKEWRIRYPPKPYYKWSDVCDFEHGHIHQSNDSDIRRKLHTQIEMAISSMLSVTQDTLAYPSRNNRPRE